MDAKRYHVQHRGRSHGPFSMRELSGRHLTADMLVRESGCDDWKPVATVEELRRFVRIVPNAHGMTANGDHGVDGRRPALAAVDLVVNLKRTRILDPIRCAIMPGEMVAIMGNSGCGKSTLLSALGGRIIPAEGRVLVDGNDLYEFPEPVRHRVGFVPQRDLANPLLTVREAISFSARWRLPRTTTDAEIASRVEDLIAQLGLAGAENLAVGNDARPGISGGQRKRVAIAIEMLTSPSILLLDEPTSGLSSVDANSIIGLLRKLAREGTTVVASIHQPSMEIFHSFDTVGVLARDDSTGRRGRLVWFGPAGSGAIDHFEPRTADAPQPSSMDGLLRGLAGRPISAWSAEWATSETKREWVDRRLQLLASTHRDRTPPSRGRTDRFLHWTTLVRRTVAVKVADRWTAWLLIAQPAVIGLLVAAAFSKPLGQNPSAENWIETGGKVGTAVFLIGLAAIWFGCSSSAREHVEDWTIFSHERRSGLSLSAYVASKFTVLGGISIIQSSVMFAVVALLCHLETPLVLVWITMVHASLSGMVIGLLISSVSRSAESATAMLPLVLMPMIILGGVLVAPKDLPLVVQPAAAMMPSRWAFEAMMLEESDHRPILHSPPPTLVMRDPKLHSDARRNADQDIHDMAEQFFPAAETRTPFWMCIMMLEALSLFTAALGVLILWHRDVVARDA